MLRVPVVLLVLEVLVPLVPGVLVLKVLPVLVPLVPEVLVLEVLPVLPAALGFKLSADHALTR